MVAEYIEVDPLDLLAGLFKTPMPGIVICLVENERDGPILLASHVGARRRLWERQNVKNETMRKRFGNIKPKKAIVVASGERKIADDGRPEGQPLPEFGTCLYVQPDKYSLRIHPGDEDFKAIGEMIPKGYTLCFYGKREPWEEFVLGEME